MGRGILLWLLGIPIPIIILLAAVLALSRIPAPAGPLRPMRRRQRAVRARITPAGSAAELIAIARNRKYRSSRLSCRARAGRV